MRLRALWMAPISVRTAMRSLPVSRAVGHDAVVGPAGPGAARASAVAAQHLRGGPAVQFHEIPFRAAPVQPGMAEMVPEPVRPGSHVALAGRRAGDHLVNPVRRHRPAVVHPEPQLRPPRLRCRARTRI